MLGSFATLLPRSRILRNSETARSIRAVSGFYDRAKQRHVVIVATKDGRVHQVYWKATTVGIEAKSTVTEFSAGSIVGVAGFYSASDQIDHIVVGLTNGRLV